MSNFKWMIEEDICERDPPPTISTITHNHYTYTHYHLHIQLHTFRASPSCEVSMSKSIFYLTDCSNPVHFFGHHSFLVLKSSGVIDPDNIDENNP